MNEITKSLCPLETADKCREKRRMLLSILRYGTEGIPGSSGSLCSGSQHLLAYGREYIMYTKKTRLQRLFNALIPRGLIMGQRMATFSDRFQTLSYWNTDR